MSEMRKNKKVELNVSEAQNKLEIYGESFDALLEKLADPDEPVQSISESPTRINPCVIGWVHSELHRLEDCPKSDVKGPKAKLEILAQYAPGLDGMGVGQKIVLLTWLHLADRNVLHRERILHSGLKQGVFTGRGPMRPNPVGLHKVRVLSIERTPEGAFLEVDALEVLDGTPILDIKIERGNWGLHYEINQAKAREDLIGLCSEAHSCGLLPGFSGNASVLVGKHCLITATGSRKSELAKNDFAMLGFDNEVVFGVPSTEVQAHIEIYKNQPEAKVILHSHPPKLLALGLRLPNIDFKERISGLPLFEAEKFGQMIASVPRLQPGSMEVAKAVGEAASSHSAIWLEGHGLFVWGINSDYVLAVSEELEHLAGVYLNSM